MSFLQKKQNPKLQITSFFSLIIICFMLAFGLYSKAFAQTNQDRWFEVEVLVFKHLSATEEQAEVFPVEVSPLSTQGSIDLISQLLNPQKYAGLITALPVCSWLPHFPQALKGFQLNTFNPSHYAFKPLPDFSSSQTFCRYQAERLQVDRLNTTSLPDPGLISWPNIPAVITGEGGNMHEQSTPFLLTDDALNMRTRKTRMEQRGIARTLLHTSWRQPVYTRSRSQLIRLFGGYNYTNEFEYAGFPLLETQIYKPENHETSAKKQQQNNQILSLLQGIQAGEFSFIAPKENQDRLPDITKQSANFYPTEVWELDGTIRIYLVGNYLHIEPNLQIREPDLFSQQRTSIEEQANTWLEGQIKDITFLRAYPLKQRKRVISHELHYFDHPKFGVLIEIRRTELSSRT